MKAVLISVLLLLATNCAKRNSGNERSIQDLAQEGVSARVMLDGRTWMTENASIAIAGSYCQQNDSLLCLQYGRLYTWEAANNVCSKMGTGWRLPSNEEWRNFAKAYGGIYHDSDDKGKSAYLSLSAGGDSAFDALLGGNREVNGNYERLEAHGFYWTSTAHDDAEAWFYNFGKGATLLNHHTGDKQRALSVRCIKEPEN
jgi:uncharacterized protein (TIGR02145 family)